MEEILYRRIARQELCLNLFAQFQRRQEVNLCWRRTEQGWTVRPDPFVDQWSREDYVFLVQCLQGTLDGGGAVFGGFLSGGLKGFASVEGRPMGSRGQYRDLTSLHVSRELRGRGMGRQLFALAARWAGDQGGEKLYISSHSAVETQAFYQAMGCREAVEYDPGHVAREPYDCQLEYEIPKS